MGLETLLAAWHGGARFISLGVHAMSGAEGGAVTEVLVSDMAEEEG